MATGNKKPVAGSKEPATKAAAVSESKGSDAGGATDSASSATASDSTAPLGAPSDASQASALSAAVIEQPVSAAADQGAAQAQPALEVVEHPAAVVETEAPAFPRLVAIVNETPIPYVIAGQHVAGNSVEHASVGSEDEVTRMKTDCAQIMSLSDNYRDAQVPALRICEVE